MAKEDFIDQVGKLVRTLAPAKPDDEKQQKELGPLALLPGTWANRGRLRGHGWNMIALPFATPAGTPDYRLLMNQYNEVFVFDVVDDNVPNRGIARNGTTITTDQHVVTLDYQQRITQLAAEDWPPSGEAGAPDLVIHHEPGLWLHMKEENLRTNGLDIGRLASVPHGNSVLALGTSEVIDGIAEIPPVDGLPIGVDGDLNNNYLAPYRHFVENPFVGTITTPDDFPGFLPTEPHLLLQRANEKLAEESGTVAPVVSTTTLHVDTEVEQAGIVNIPFIDRQADATSMTSTFWIQELAEKDKMGKPKLRLQYLQVVFLDFFQRRDGNGLIRWPHVSINTMEKVAEPKQEELTMPYKGSVRAA